MRVPAIVAVVLGALVALGAPVSGQGTAALSVRNAAPVPLSSGWLGLTLDLRTTVMVDKGRSASSTTLQVTRLFTGGPAERAGVRVGDRITRLNGTPVTPELFDRVARRLAPGDPVAVEVERAGRRLQFSLTADPRPSTQELLPRTLQSQLDSARLVFVDRLDASLSRLRQGLGEEFLAQVAPGVVQIQAERVLPRFRVQTVTGDSLHEVTLHVVDVQGYPGSVAPETGATATGLLRRSPAPAEVRPGSASVPGSAVAWRGYEGGRLVVRTDSAEVDVTLRPLAPYLFGADRAAGARFIPLAPGMRSIFGVRAGVVTAEVIPGTPAEEAGLRAGDVVTAIAGVEVTTLDEVRRALARSGGAPTLTVVRKGRTLELKLGR